MSLSSSELIYAQATPPGRAALSIIRASGTNAWSKVSPALSVDKIESHKAYYSKIYSGEQFIDEVLITFFGDKKSFTGEESFEITCHGSPLIVQDIMGLLNELGFRHAEPGEFSYRAFVNGKIDLTQAEGIHHTIHSESHVSKSMALNLLAGNFKKSLLELKEDLMFVASRLEASIDFSEQDIDLGHRDLILDKSALVQSKLENLLGSYRVGAAQLKGIRVALAGPPNSGKSSLFNKILNSKRSIVSEEAGTTRDYISDVFYLKSCPVEIVDTAGVREASGAIEKEGISRSIDIAKESQLILFLVSEENLPFLESSLKPYEELETRVLLVLTKQDLSSWNLSHESYETASLSLEDEKLYQSFMGKVEQILEPYLTQGSHLFLERHFELLSKTNEKLSQFIDLPQLDGFEDVAVSMIYQALSFLDEMLYIENPEQVRDKIFKDFCLGK